MDLGIIGIITGAVLCIVMIIFGISVIGLKNLKYKGGEENWQNITEDL